MTTLQVVLLSVYAVGAAIFCPYFWIVTYREGFSDNSVRPGNPRSATLVAILYGGCWPVLLVMFCVYVFADWVQRGGR